MADVERDATGSDEMTCKQLLKRIAAEGKTTHFHLFLYNSIRKHGDTSRAIDSLIEKHSNLMALHGFMAGFQFIAITGDVVFGEVQNNAQTTAIILLVVGFMMNLFGTNLSLVTMGYLKSIADESLRMQVEGILKFWTYFRCSDMFAIGSTVTLATTVNILLHDILPTWLSYTLNGLSAVVFLFGSYFFVTSTMLNQPYGGGRHIYREFEGIRENKARV